MTRHKLVATFGFFILMGGMVVGLHADIGQVDFDSQWDSAENIRQQASIAGYEWRDTEKILRNARKAYRVGSEARAFYLLSKGLAEGNAALAQAAREEGGWKHRVIK